MSQQLPPSVRRAIDSIARRQLVAPAMLFVVSHRPMAFMVGQAAALFVPLAALLGQSALADWADLLSDPEGAALLERTLQAEGGSR